MVNPKGGGFDSSLRPLSPLKSIGRSPTKIKITNLTTTTKSCLERYFQKKFGKAKVTT